MADVIKRLKDAADFTWANLKAKAHASTHGANGNDPLALTQAQIANLVDDLEAKAPLASPALTGTPTAPTAADGADTTQIATTAFVANAMTGIVSVSDGTKGDVVVSGDGLTWNLNSDVVTPAARSVLDDPTTAAMRATLGVVIGTDVQPYNATTALITTQALTDGATINWNVFNGAFATITLGGNRTLANPTNLVAGASYAIKVIQDGTGNRTLAYGSAYKWPGGTAPSLSTAAGAVDILTFISDGTAMYGAIQKAWS